MKKHSACVRVASERTKGNKRLRFSMPNQPCDFALPDDWWLESGMANFVKATPSYRSDEATAHVPMKEIEPPYRPSDVPKDWLGFDRERLMQVLQGIATGASLPPVPLTSLPGEHDFPPAPYRYRVRDGYHRF